MPKKAASPPKITTEGVGLMASIELTIGLSIDAFTGSVKLFKELSARKTKLDDCSASAFFRHNDVDIKTYIIDMLKA